MFFVYSLVLIAAIILNALILRDLKRGVTAFSGIKSNLVSSHLHWSKKMGGFYYVVFFGFHTVMAIYGLSIGAWISVLALITYMILRPRVWAALTWANWGIIGAPVAGVGPSVPDMEPTSGLGMSTLREQALGGHIRQVPVSTDTNIPTQQQ